LNNHFTVIIADDDDDDTALLTEALAENDIPRDKVVVARDGDMLLNLLPAFTGDPCLVFLDLNMPKKNGFKALVEIKSNPRFRHIPILVLTTSNSRKDISKCYEMGANTYFTKPFSYTELINLVRAVKVYWLESAVMSVSPGNHGV
jgi:DNA-binding response OmpR family regulator